MGERGKGGGVQTTARSAVGCAGGGGTNLGTNRAGRMAGTVPLNYQTTD